MHVYFDIIIVQGGTYANDVKGYGATYPCGWMGIKSQVGFQHPTKKGKVTIPFHTKGLSKSTEQSILKQAGLK